jgi:hypothetical protein
MTERNILKIIVVHEKEEKPADGKQRHHHQEITKERPGRLSFNFSVPYFSYFVYHGLKNIL